MAEDPKPEPQKFRVFNLDDTSIETVYANTTHAIVGEGDITIYFGFQSIEGNNVPASDVKRVAMTHDSFMRMMEYWASRYRLLETLYNGKPPALRNLDPVLVTAAFDTMLGRSSQETNQNDTIDATGNKTEPLNPTNGT